MSEKKYLICSKPFEWFEASSLKDYSVFLCCSGWLPKTVGHLADQSPSDIWHSQEAKEIRRSVLDGSFKYCNKEFCPHLNSVSGPVKYVDKVKLDMYLKKIEDADFAPTYLNCSYDKSCNLACPSCRVDIVMAKGAERDTISKLGYKLFESFGSSLKTVYMTGSGDPFASKHFLDILTNGTLKKYPEVKLHLHTNAQLFTEATWEKIRQSREIIDIMEVSIDGASSSTYEKNRAPGKWDVLLSNMKFIGSLKRSGRISYLKISFVVQQNNYFEMQKFIEYGKVWSVDCVYFSTLNNWFTFSNSDYLERAVHKKDHPEHNLLLKELRKIDTMNSRLELGYFKELLQPKFDPIRSILGLLRKKHQA